LSSGHFPNHISGEHMHDVAYCLPFLISHLLPLCLFFPFIFFEFYPALSEYKMCYVVQYTAYFLNCDMVGKTERAGLPLRISCSLVFSYTNTIYQYFLSLPLPHTNTLYSYYSPFLTESPNSTICSTESSRGAFITAVCPPRVMGNATTSRSWLSLVRFMTLRSTPRAMPP
jgi:hypothetical protein